MCEWCRNPNAEDITPNLCPPHRAEALGTSVADLERGEREQYAEWLDTRR